ncbi:hypothetical protein [Marinobacterium jannaschii]|uniref:hypothetical protein n=1 Tax=Marinobacterium jannaschii TaxID=64970 RepID=UPI0012EC2CBE|nr:hypothetical protein [Marinobacterium jannaschii]
MATIAAEIFKLGFTTCFAAIFIDYFRRKQHERYLRDIKKDAFYNAFNIDLPDAIQNTIRNQLFEKKVYRSKYSLRYIFKNYDADNLIVTASSEYYLNNASDKKQKHLIRRDVESSKDEEGDTVSIMVDDIQVTPKKTKNSNSKITYVFSVDLVPNGSVKVQTHTTTIKSRTDSDAIYCLLLTGQMEVDVIFALDEEEYECECEFFSLCDNDTRREENSGKSLGLDCPNVFNWACNSPLLKYQGVKVQWKPKKNIE